MRSVVGLVDGSLGAEIQRFARRERKGYKKKGMLRLVVPVGVREKARAMRMAKKLVGWLVGWAGGHRG